ncbi:MAG: hypothetical protein J7493_08400 [Porphyrobacter sp.]|nr:hypothetical protein [Porphyrobacter sp.]
MTRRRNRNKINATGRNSNSRFARLDYRILNSNAYRALSPNDRSLLVELVMLYNGENNGSLYLSVRDGAHRMGIADLSGASRSFDTLQALGFIQLMQDAHFSVKASEKSRARCWRLTWLAGPGRKAPSWEFLDLEPRPQAPARKRMERGLRALKSFRYGRDNGKFPVLDSNTLSPFPPGSTVATVLHSNTQNDGNCGFPPIACVRDSATHIATPWGEGATHGLFGWWQPDWNPSIKAWSYAALSSAMIADHIEERRAA